MTLKQCLAALALAALGAHAQADTYPSRAVRIVVPYAPGGAVDAVTRKIAQQLTLQTGQAFVVENKAGAASTIGAGIVANAEPDGYTLMTNDTTFSLLPFIFKTLPWGPKTGLAPVSAFMFAPMAVVVRADSPYRTLKDLLDAARAHPGKITFGTGGMGTSPHFATEALGLATRTEMLHVPFKGAGEATIAVLSGTIDFQIASTPGIMSQVKGGSVRLLAISGDKRLEAIPDVPTFREAGVDQDGVINFTGLWAPKGTPPAIMARLESEIGRAMASADVRAFANGLGAIPRALDDKAFAKMLADNGAIWASVARAINLRKQ
jgi:tripartite-type tricarboxylate transporter receptor subunit TctC